MQLPRCPQAAPPAPHAAAAKPHARMQAALTTTRRVRLVRRPISSGSAARAQPLASSTLTAAASSPVTAGGSSLDPGASVTMPVARHALSRSAAAPRRWRTPPGSAAGGGGVRVRLVGGAAPHGASRCLPRSASTGTPRPAHPQATGSCPCHRRRCWGAAAGGRARQGSCGAGAGAGSDTARSLGVARTRRCGKGERWKWRCRIGNCNGWDPELLSLYSGAPAASSTRSI